MTKTFIIVAAAGVVTITTALAQAPEGPDAAPVRPPGDSARGSSQIVASQGKDEWLASKLKGTAVLGSDNQKLGDIVDILLDKGGHVRALIVGVGGVLGVGAKQVAIELGEFREVPGSDGNKAQLKVPMTKDQLTQAPNFKTLPSPPATTTGSAPRGSPSPRSPSR